MMALSIDEDEKVETMLDRVEKEAGSRPEFTFLRPTNEMILKALGQVR